MERKEKNRNMPGKAKNTLEFKWVNGRRLKEYKTKKEVAK